MDEGADTFGPERAHLFELARLLEESAWMRRLAAKLVGEAQAEDVVQDTFLAAMRGAPRERGPAGLRAWLAVVTRNLALKRRRSETLRRDAEQCAAAVESVDTGAEYERVRLHQRLAGAVLELREPYRAAVVLRYFDGLDTRAIAERTGASPVAVRQRLTRGLGMLRARLDREFGDRSAWCLALGAIVPKGTGTLATPWLLGGTALGIKVMLGTVALVGLVVSAALWLERPEPAAAVALPPVEATVEADAKAEVDGASRLATEFESPPTVGGRRAAAIEAEDRLPSVSFLQGQVTDSFGRPLPGTSVRWKDIDAVPVLTDGAGEFRLPLRSPATSHAAVVADREGHVRVVAEIDGTDFLNIVLPRLPRLTGFLTDESGKSTPSPGKVGVDVEERASGMTREHVAAIDERGTFLFPALPVGRVTRAWALVAGYPEHTVNLDRALLPDGEGELRLTLPDGVVAHGVVLDAVTERPIPGAAVWADTVRFDSDSLRPTTYADAAGRFRLAGVNPGEFTIEGGQRRVFLLLYASADGYTETVTRAYSAAWDDAGSYEFELRVKPTECSLAGLVSRPDGTPAASAHVHAVDSQGRYRFKQADAEGGFVFEGLPAGAFSLMARLGEIGDPGGGSCGYADVDLDPALPIEELRLALIGAGTTSIRGVCSDPRRGEDPDSLSVLAELVFEANNVAIAIDSVETQVDSAGVFDFAALSPGLYQVSLPSAGGEGCARPLSMKFRIGQDEVRSDVRFEVGGCLRVAGHVDPGGRSMRSLRVVLFDSREHREVDDVGPDANGAFRLGPVLAARYELRVMIGDELLSEPLAVGPGSEAGLLLRVAR